MRSKPWCLACNSAYFIAKLSKNNVGHNNSQLIRRPAVARTQSHIILDICSDSDTSSNHVDSDQNIESIDDINVVISVDKDDYFHMSSTSSTLAMTFLNFVVEAVKSIPAVTQIILAFLSLAFGIKFHGHNKGWYDGGSIFISTSFTVLISATINFKHNQVLNNPINKFAVDDNRKPLQAQVKKVSSYIMKLGLLVALLLLVVLPIRTLVPHGGQNVNAIDAIMKIILAAINIVVIAKSESLLLAAALTVAYSIEEMLKQNILIRRLSVWENMGSITVICTDKSDTLHVNQMGVTELWVGKEKVEPSTLAPDIVERLQEAVGLNNTSGGMSTSIVYQSASELTAKVSGCPTEKAIFEWGVNDLEVKMDEMSKKFEYIKVDTFESEKRQSRVMARRKTDNTIQIHFKGAAQVTLAMCSNYYDQRGMRKAIADEDKNHFRMIIQNMGVKGLTCIAFAQKQECDTGDDNAMQLSEKENGGLTLLGIVGLAFLSQAEVREAIESCRNTGVDVKLITEDGKSAATKFGLDCGILNPNSHELHEDAVIEGTKFRNYSEQERLEKVDHIQVMASSSVQDKLLLVKCLKQKHHVVAITGINSEDAPTLQEANVGLALGIKSTEDVKESSDIVILDENHFASIATIIKWGRCCCTNIQKVIQVQITIVAVGSIVSFSSAISSGNLPPLWANILLDTLLSLALATTLATEDNAEFMKLLEQPTRTRDDQRTNVSKAVWRNIIGQTLYQLAILLTLQIKGQLIFGIGEEVQDTLIFNCFLLCQVFNLFNARKLEKKNIFEGITLECKSFWLIVGITVIVQFFMVELFCKFANTERLNWGQWAACVGIAAFSWPIGCLVKCITIQFRFCGHNIHPQSQDALPAYRIFNFLRPLVLLPFLSFAP